MFVGIWRWLLIIMLLLGHALAQAEVNVYSSRKEALILPLLQAFTADTGVEVKLLTGKDDALLHRLSMAGDASPADLLITTDVARLYRAKAEGLIQAVDSPILQNRVPAQWRDSEGYWFGVTSRARPIIYAKFRVDPASLTNYADLAKPRWKGRLCLRSSDNVYNQSLVASKLHADGQATTLQWLSGMVANLARSPAGGDTDQLKAVAAGMCDLTLANTYYLARLARSTHISDNMVANQLEVLWPNQADRGSHFNISGVALTKAAKHKQQAVQLMEYMVSDAAQAWYAEVNNEYPVVPDVPMPMILRTFGQAKPDTVALSVLGQLNRQAVILMDQAGWR